MERRHFLKLTAAAAVGAMIPGKLAALVPAKPVFFLSFKLEGRPGAPFNIPEVRIDLLSAPGNTLCSMCHKRYDAHPFNHLGFSGNHFRWICEHRPEWEKRHIEKYRRAVI